MGAKSYAYKTNKGKTVIKQRGVTVDRANDDLFVFDAYVQVVHDELESITSAERFSFKWDETSKNVIKIYFTCYKIYST